MSERAIKNGWGWVLGVKGDQYRVVRPATEARRARLAAEIEELEQLIEERREAFGETNVPCTCTDSIRAAIGTCPEWGHREYHSCPKRKGAQPKGDNR